MSMRELLESLSGVTVVIDEHGDDRHFLVTGGDYSSIKKIIDDWNDAQGKDYKKYKFWGRTSISALNKIRELTLFMEDGRSILDGVFYCPSGEVHRVIKSKAEKQEYIESLLVRVRDIWSLSFGGVFENVYEMTLKLKHDIFDYGKAVSVPYHIAIEELVKISKHELEKRRQIEVKADHENLRGIN